MLRHLDHVSWPGSASRPNEDACGSAGSFAWVIDASIAPGSPCAMGQGSDAAWLAGFSSRMFGELAPEAKDGAALIAEVAARARAAFGDLQRPALSWPVAALSLVRSTPGRLQVWSLGDVSAYLRRPSESVEVVGLGRALRAFERGEAERLLRETGSRPGEVAGHPAFRAWLAAMRLKAAEHGLVLFGLEPLEARRIPHRTVPAPPETMVLLASDGFAALVDLYAAYDPDSLMMAALRLGLEPLVREARAIEAADPDAERFPRFKRSDDATALLLKQG